jgi:mannose-binding lectin 1
MFHSGNSNNDEEYELCLRAENVILPQFGYFGVSAATGGLADDHDALKFLTYSVHVPGSQQAPAAGQPAINQAEHQKIDHQYEEFKTKLEKQKEEYFKSHPEEAKKFHEKEELDPEHDYGSLADRELQQIFDGQSQMYEALKSLNRKLDEILGRQERTLSMIGSVGVGGGQPAQGGQGVVGTMPIQRHEVEALLGSQREVLQSTRDIRTTVMNQAGVPASQQVGQGQAPNPLQSQLLTEIREGINILRKEMTHVGQKVVEQSAQAPLINCPASPSCVSPTMMVFFLGIHLVLTIGYMVVRNGKDSAAKKFY